MRLQQIELLRQCAGLPPESPLRSVPTLRIVNHQFGAGRWGAELIILACVLWLLWVYERGKKGGSGEMRVERVVRWIALGRTLDWAVCRAGRP